MELNRIRVNLMVKRYNVDMIFLPFVKLSCVYSDAIPSVGVLPDAQGFVLRNDKYRQAITNHTKNISKIVTISQYAKDDIIKYLPHVSGKIEVIPNSVDVGKFECTDDNVAREQYILNVNTLLPYKNLITLVKAFNLIKDIIPHKLLVKAKKTEYWDSVIYPFIQANDLIDRVVLIEDVLNDAEMETLYRNADLFVSPSLMEGFGYSPIEAAMCEVPVVCTKETALYETTKGLLNYYEPPTDEFALKDAMLEILSGQKDSERLSYIANTYRDSYSLATQATLYMSLFEDVIRSSWRKEI